MAENIVVFCTHSDDHIIGMGGTIAKYAKEGKRVYAFIFCYGEGSHLWLKTKVTVKMRVEEAKKAGKIVGIKGTSFLGLNDSEVKDGTKKGEFIDGLVRIINKYRPSKIFTHSEDDMLYGHKYTHKAVMKAVEKSGYTGELYFFNIWLTDFRRRNTPKLVVDVSDTFEAKKNAILCFKSQHIVLAQLLPKEYSRAMLQGASAGVKFAEAFARMERKDG